MAKSSLAKFVGFFNVYVIMKPFSPRDNSGHFKFLEMYLWEDLVAPLSRNWTEEKAKEPAMQFESCFPTFSTAYIQPRACTQI